LTPQERAEALLSTTIAAGFNDPKVSYTHFDGAMPYQYRSLCYDGIGRTADDQKRMEIFFSP
jgi:hypothetical protein